jgi:O-antigen/teichoic acid export membrane protein
MSFIRSSLVLVSGTALAHGITAAVLPLLSRIYTPNDFGLLAVFTSIVAIVSVCACLRFDIAIALPEKDSEALSLLILSLGFALLTAILVLIAVSVAPNFVANTLKQPQLQSYLWLLPLTIFMASSYNALLTWNIREKRFSYIAKSRVAQSVGAAGIQITSGLFGLTPVGLLIGYSMNAGAACIVFGCALIKNKLHVSKIKEITWQSVKDTFKVYDRFPKYSTWEALCNSASMQLPILLIAALAAPQETGYLMMATFVMQAPTALVGASIGQVYLSQAAEKHREGQLDKFTTSIVISLIKAGSPVFICAGLLSPFVFGIVFGREWDRSGLLILWMTPWFIMQFITVPVSMSLHITGNQKIAVWIQVFGLCFRTSVVWLASIIEPSMIVEVYALSGALFYAAYLFLINKKIKFKN